MKTIEPYFTFLSKYSDPNNETDGYTVELVLDKGMVSKLSVMLNTVNIYNKKKNNETDILYNINEPINMFMYSELEFIIPQSLNYQANIDLWNLAMEHIENMNRYIHRRAEEDLSDEDVYLINYIMPNSTKTEIVITATYNGWKDILLHYFREKKFRKSGYDNFFKQLALEFFRINPVIFDGNTMRSFGLNITLKNEFDEGNKALKMIQENVSAMNYALKSLENPMLVCDKFCFYGHCYYNNIYSDKNQKCPGEPLEQKYPCSDCPFKERR